MLGSITRAFENVQSPPRWGWSIVVRPGIDRQPRGSTERSRATIETHTGRGNARVSRQLLPRWTVHLTRMRAYIGIGDIGARYRLTHWCTRFNYPGLSLVDSPTTERKRSPSLFRCRFSSPPVSRKVDRLAQHAAGDCEISQRRQETGVSQDGGGLHGFGDTDLAS